MRLVKTIYPVNIFFFRAIRLSLIFFPDSPSLSPRLRREFISRTKLSKGTRAKIRTTTQSRIGKVVPCVRVLLLRTLCTPHFDFGRVIKSGLASIRSLSKVIAWTR